MGWTQEPEQVKQKFGTLWFYGEGFTKEMHNRIGEAEMLSAFTCEECGEPGKMQTNRGFYVTCSKHVQQDFAWKSWY